MFVREIMQPRPVCIDAGRTIIEAITMMEERKVTWMPVMENGRTVGIISDRDVAIRSFFGRIRANTKLSEVVYQKPIACRGTDTVETAAQRMIRKKVPSLLVLDDENQPCGIVTLKEITRGLGDPGLLDAVRTLQANVLRREPRYRKIV
jgi:CBS domain-containing protein